MKIKNDSVSFAKIPNTVLHDERLSLRAKGIFAYMESKPNDWNFSHRRISIENNDGKKSVLAAMKELEKFGYLERKKFKNEKGFWVWEHRLFSTSPDTLLGHTVNPCTLLRHTGKGGAVKGCTKKERYTKKDIQRKISPASAGAEASVETKKIGVGLVVEVIDMFIKIDAQNKNAYKNKTQRASVERILESHGIENLRKIIPKLPQILSLPYMPAGATTPYAFEKNIEKIKIRLEQEKKKKNGTNIVIA